MPPSFATTSQLKQPSPQAAATCSSSVCRHQPAQATSSSSHRHQHPPSAAITISHIHHQLHTSSAAYIISSRHHQHQQPSPAGEWKQSDKTLIACRSMSFPTHGQIAAKLGKGWTEAYIMKKKNDTTVCVITFESSSLWLIFFVWNNFYSYM